MAVLISRRHAHYLGKLVHHLRGRNRPGRQPAAPHGRFTPRARAMHIGTVEGELLVWLEP
jgi:hypothetical protein